jgi:hypothetical protein
MKISEEVRTPAGIALVGNRKPGWQTSEGYGE